MYIKRLGNFDQIAFMLRSGRCLPTHVAAHCLQIRFVCCTRYWLSLAAPTKKFVHPETLFFARGSGNTSCQNQRGHMS